VTGYDVHTLREREFPWAARRDAVYLDNASTGPLPARTQAVLAAQNAKRAEPFRLRADDLFPVLQKARERAAALIGAPPASIALMPNTTYGVNLAARALAYGKGDVVLSTHGEFPANVYPWMAAARARGAQFRLLPLAGDLPDESALMRTIHTDPYVKVVALSWVSFWSGYRFDLERVGAACRARGIWFFVDAIQGVGALALDVLAANVDVLACGAQKWLCAPWGTGFAYVRPELILRMEPAAVGWLAQSASDDFTRMLRYDPRLRDDARRFEVFTLDFASYAAMAESLGLFLELGPREIEAHVRALGDHAVTFCDAHPTVQLVTPREPERRAGVLAFRVPDAAAASERLKAARVFHAVREGTVRLAPHFYNTTEELDRALEVMAG
jgi:selenocysteine lyase/cysteine desulfurase